MSYFSVNKWKQQCCTRFHRLLLVRVVRVGLIFYRLSCIHFCLLLLLFLCLSICPITWISCTRSCRSYPLENLSIFLRQCVILSLSLLLFVLVGRGRESRLMIRMEMSYFSVNKWTQQCCTRFHRHLLVRVVRVGLIF